MSQFASYIAKLQAGETVSLRPQGGSMKGLIESGQLCTVEPVSGDRVKKGEVVLCRVMGCDYLHLVKAVRGKGGECEFLIGNNRGGTNGWTRAVYGRCVQVEP